MLYLIQFGLKFCWVDILVFGSGTFQGTGFCFKIWICYGVGFASNFSLVRLGLVLCVGFGLSTGFRSGLGSDCVLSPAPGSV